MSNKNLPQIKHEGFFEKIKNWFKKLFKAENIEMQEPVQSSINEINEQVDEIKKDTFKQSIKTDGKDKILVLQRKLKEKQIEISSLTDEELDEMIEIYKKQIEEKKNKLIEYSDKVKKN